MSLRLPAGSAFATAWRSHLHASFSGRLSSGRVAATRVAMVLASGHDGRHRLALHQLASARRALATARRLLETAIATPTPLAAPTGLWRWQGSDRWSLAPRV